MDQAVNLYGFLLSPIITADTPTMMPDSFSLSQRESLFSALMHNNPTAIVMLDIQGMVTTCNHAFEELFGYYLPEMQGRHIDLFITNQDNYQEALDYTERVTRGEVIRITSRRWRRDGTPVDVESQGVPVVVEGKLIGVLTFYHDITHLKQAEQAQSEIYQSFARMMDSLDADIYVSSLETYQILFMNRHMKQSFGDNLVGKICYFHFRNLDAPCLHCTNSLLLDEHGHPNPPVVWEGQNPITKCWYKNSDCAIRWGEAGYARLQIATDITELKDAEHHMAQMATHDFLTGLPNRILLEDRMEHALNIAHRNSKTLTLLFLDLDKFKEINDSYGHKAGDQVLQEAARRMSGCMRECDTLARISGDEFVFLFEDTLNNCDIAGVADRLLNAIRQPIILDQQTVNITASIGVSCFPQDGQNIDTLLQHADSAMYAVKKQGGNGFRLE